MPRDRKVTDAGRSVSQLKVTLVDSQPAIWRRVQVESTDTLQELQRILQVVMGWTDSHMHAFRFPESGQRGARRRLRPIESADEKTTRVGDLLRQPKDWLVYEYDFGDSWEHAIVLEEIVPRASTARYPMVLAGRGACPPEDVGGLPGYYHFLEAIKNPKDPDHEDMVEWGGEGLIRLPSIFRQRTARSTAAGARGGRMPDNSFQQPVLRAAAEAARSPDKPEGQPRT